MAVNQTLTVTEVSTDTAANTSKVRILWTSTQTGESYNGYTRTAKYYISINGGTETEYSVSYTLPYQSTKTILDTTITVPHKDDGSGNITVRTWLDTGISAGVITKSQSLTLTTIARASTISSASDVTLGNSCSVKWIPKSASYYYDLLFSVGNWRVPTGKFRPGQTTTYTYNMNIPLSVAEQIINAKSGTMTVTLYTYSDSTGSTQIGSSDSKTVTVTVPDNDTTKATVSMTLSAESSLPTQFDGLYIQGKSKVKAELSAVAKYNANIASYSVNVENKEYGASENYTSDYLSGFGMMTVTGYAKDSRGYLGSVSEDITVIAYNKPIIQADAYRCDENGEQDDLGTYLKIEAKRIYSKVISGDTQKNYCAIRYRYKTAAATAYSSWVTILSGDTVDNDEIITAALLNGTLLAELSYVIQVQVIDDIGQSSVTSIDIPTGKVYMHRDGARRSLTFGGYVEEDNTFAIAEDITFKALGEKWISIGLSDNVEDETVVIGRAPASGCYYRVVSGNHIYISFACSFTYTGEAFVVNENPIPSELRPKRSAYAFCALSGKNIARVFVNTRGYVYIEWIQSLTSGSETTNVTSGWIDGCIDYFI